MWAHRIVLEAGLHRDNAFVTLTYSDEHIRNPNVGGTLAPEDTRDWLKRLRFAISPRSVRYYLVGEYGDQSGRPHYHAALFGYPKCLYGRSRYSKERKDCCSNCDLIRDTWGLGLVDVGNLEVKSAKYIAGYIIKKMTRFDDRRLNGRHPEFARMSLKPGLGADALHEMASVFLKFDLDITQGDVPSSLRHGKQLLPLGRYLRGKYRELVGMDKNAPQSTLDLMAEELRLLLTSQNISPEALRALPPDQRNTIIKNAVIDAGEQKRINARARRAIYQRKRSY